jgi:adenylate cyclase
VKGKTRGITIYELLGELDESATCPAHITRYEKAFELYSNGDFNGALEMFSSFPSDPPSVAMAERCRTFLETPPPGAWDGTFVLHTK